MDEDGKLSRWREEKKKRLERKRSEWTKGQREMRFKRGFLTLHCLEKTTRLSRETSSGKRFLAKA